MYIRSKEGIVLKALSEKELFETVSVPRAVATLAIPTVIRQLVTMIYNLADTFFIGQIGDPYMVAAVSLVSPWFNLLTALGNLFGLGGSSLISRLLGAKRNKDIRYVSVFSVWGGAAATVIFAAGSYAARDRLLGFLGASFLRIACIAVPLTSVKFLISYTLQAMGEGMQSAMLTFSRQGLLNIPLLILMNIIFGLYGMIWTQLVVEVIMLPVSIGMYMRTLKSLR